MTSNRPRARDLGINLRGTTGPLNAITDVAGVEVGYTTLIEGDGPLTTGQGPVRTGVSAIFPRGRDGVGNPCAAGRYSLNGNGEMTGMHWIDEVGELSMPITISNTHAVGACHTGVIEWMNANHPQLARQWLLPVCAETWDGYLNDINGGHVTPAMARQALDAARRGPVEEGSVGGGTGMNCYGFKGGNGTSSRVVSFGDTAYTVGAFVQANFGSRDELTIAGIPAGQLLTVENPMEDTDWFEQDLRVPGGSGSVIVVVATDAPLNAAQCKGLARRVPLGLARTGTTGSLFSGDIFLAFSTADNGPSRTGFPTTDPVSDEIFTVQQLPWNRIDLFYAATVYAVEEAVLNALVVNQTMVGRDSHVSPALPHDQLQKLLGTTN
ncbi:MULTISPECIES: P1 family peptidase [unclassified Mycolicibacterium]|uniref:DmpA family aminopeptidase n=1 Tax=unclassified Mycolicibacterium TaxID=2636767 RepID=UPI001307C096|nr:MULTISPECIES: P1 family peptidase [unclassified Mycolicibacterium]MUL85203.1 P1 family peptidase [Mycolicibacterium sp. CBMA 329]MUL91170.1 P1 family peptidase [Mycolicibacterium sp. CBMA 331]MUL98161.1 P1 family peptidase [Mycolicibacterium sp. CBMA 334]MUM40929.1 P1 family peptidase [Mycolicibacterium sp. CBMA 247]MUM47125.1 P1 family peptidase [Mycolicibacterium sp. CBMA 294]